MMEFSVGTGKRPLTASSGQSALDQALHALRQAPERFPAAFAALEHVLDTLDAAEDNTLTTWRKGRVLDTPSLMELLERRPELASALQALQDALVPEPVQVLRLVQQTPREG